MKPCTTPSSPGLIETVPWRGYRFVADVTILKPLALVSPAASSSRWRSRSAIFAAVLVVLAAGIAWAIAVSRRGPIRPAVTVLVLPFDTLSGTTSGESVYGDIASAELTRGLARLDPKTLGVIDPLTARKFKNTKECIIHIGTQLGADYVLLGDVQQSSNTTKIAAQLFKVSTNRQVWATEELIPAASGFSLFLDQDDGLNCLRTQRLRGCKQIINVKSTSRQWNEIVERCMLQGMRITADPTSAGKIRNLSSSSRFLACLTVTILSGFSISCLAAQKGASHPRDSTRDTFQDPSHSIAFPFEWSEGMIVLPVSIRGSKPLRFVLDSGSSRILIDRRLAASLGLKTAESGSLQGAGAGRVRFEAGHGVDIQLPGLESRGYDFYTADLAPLEQTLKTRVDGIIGYDLFARFVITVDFITHQLTIASPASFRPNGRAEQVPLDIHNKWAFVKGELVLPGPVTVQDSFFIDSGSSDAVDHPIVKTIEARTSTTSGVGLGTPVEGSVARAQSFRLGKFLLEGPPVTCCGATGETSRLIGTEILRRFTVTFDYPSSRLFLEPNDAFGQSFASSAK